MAKRAGESGGWITPRMVLAAVLTLSLLSAVATAQPAAQPTEKTNAGKPDAAKPTPPAAFTAYPDAPSVTYHTITLNGEAVHYEATAGTITLVDERGEYEPKARVFFIAYRRTLYSPEEHARRLEAGEDPDTLYPDPTTRPLTFSFNGGPGSSSVWLHLGVFGPKRVRYADDMGNPGPAPYTVTDNDHSLLGVSDFVFIDPVSTGYSRPEGDTSAKDYHGVEPDIASVGEFIRRYISTEHRWSSPKFIAGESYGTTRAAGLAEHLHERHGIAVNGVVLISSVLEFSTIRFGVGNDMPYICFLPGYAAAAHFHGKLGGGMQAMSVSEVYQAAKDFALGDYASALMKGDELQDAEHDRIRRRLAEFTGLSEDYIERANLRISQPRFSKELLRDQGETVGRFDARFTGFDRDNAGESYDYDPSYAVIRASYTGAFNDYIRRELDYASDLPYEILTSVWPWDYGPSANARYLNVAERLRSVMHEQPSMRVFVAGGYHDLATPILGVEYTITHMQLNQRVRPNVTTHLYRGGHMMYLDRASFAALAADLKAFYEQTPLGPTTE